MSADFLGRGWAFPVAVDQASGRILPASGDEGIRQAIQIILGTAPGERPMLPDFGCRLQEMVFGLNNASLAGLAETAVREALVRWEPRIDVLGVTAGASPDHPELLLIQVQYEVRSTNSRYNLVYPFYLEG
jgi:phage baseplate assembly protein W